MKKSFQLSAVAIAIAASSSVMADVIDTLVTPSFNTDTLNSVAANTITANNQLFVAGQDVGSTLAQNTTDISTNTNTINQEIADRQIGDAAITAGIAANVTTAQLNATDATVTGTLTANAVNIVNANSVGVPNTSTTTSGISTTQKYNAGTIAGIANDVYKITEQDPSTGNLTDKYFTRNAITGTYTKVELDANQKAALPFTGNKTGPTTNITTIEDVVTSQSIINGQKVDFSNSKTRDTTVDIKGQLAQIDANGNPVGQPENVNGQALSNQVDLEKNRAAIGILDRDGNPQTQDDYYGVNTVKTIYDETTKTRKSGDTTIEGDSIILTSTTTVDGTLTGTKTTSVNASGITTGQIVVDGTDVKATLDANTAAIAQEVLDRAAADTALNGRVDQEVLDRAAADTALNGRVDQEVLDRAAADTALNGRVDQEVLDRAAADTALNGRVDQEVLDRAAADTALNGRVDQEVLDRAAADTALNGRVDQEVLDRAAADTALNGRVDQEVLDRAAADTALNGRVDQEVLDRAAADTALNGRVDQEVLDRAAADTALNGRVDQEVLDRAAADTALNGRVDQEVLDRAAADTQLQANIDTEAATRAAADTALNTRVDNETAARTAADTQLQANIDTEAATRAAADTALNTRVDNETAARTAADAATLTSAKGYTDTTATTLRSEAAAETVRVNKAIVDGDAATLASANAYTDGRANQLNTRIDDVQRTAYRGIAISLAAQQAVPSIQPGQVAIFGGVGHYEGETAGSIGVVTAFTDRLSASGAFGFAGGNEFGGRVGVAYVFGGK